jgi:hypothetical protein
LACARAQKSMSSVSQIFKKLFKNMLFFAQLFLKLSFQRAVLKMFFKNHFQD